MLSLINRLTVSPSPWVGHGRWKKRGVAALKFSAFTAFCTLLGLIVGIMVVIMPPMAWISVTGLAVIVLLWVMPDLPKVPDELIWKLFLLSVLFQFTTPLYYAVSVPGLPWISLRRLVWFPTLVLTALAIAASSDVRGRTITLIQDAKYITAPGIAFFLWIWLSVFTSISWPDTLSDILNSYLYWAMAFLVCVVCVRGPKEARFVLALLCSIAFIAGPFGFIEYILNKRFIIDLWPPSFIDDLISRNPRMFENITRDTSRNGAFRANFIYNVSLSYGEFLAICAPIATFFALHARFAVGKALAVVCIFMCVLGVFASGARGGYTGIAISVPFVLILWMIRYMKAKPNSMVGVIAAVSFFGAMVGFIGLLAIVKDIRWKFTGGYEGVASTDVRYLQFEMALPSILSNPLTGYGHGVGNGVVGYFTPGGIGSVDSYLITLLVDAGVPNLVFFFFMVIAAIVMNARVYLTDTDPISECCVALSGALLSFTSYRIVLSQLENHFLLFVLLGLSVVQISAIKRRNQIQVTAAQSAREKQAAFRPRQSSATMVR